MCQLTGRVFPEQSRNFTAISVGHNAILLQDIVAKILGFCGSPVVLPVPLKWREEREKEERIKKRHS